MDQSAQLLCALVSHMLRASNASVSLEEEHKLAILCQHILNRFGGNSYKFNDSRVSKGSGRPL